MAFKLSRYKGRKTKIYELLSFILLGTRLSLSRSPRLPETVRILACIFRAEIESLMIWNERGNYRWDWKDTLKIHSRVMYRCLKNRTTEKREKQRDCFAVQRSPHSLGSSPWSGAHHPERSTFIQCL